ncbi:MAG: hypothetical protein AB1765_01830 [Candidatus Hydrogenedentota bacterium]
MIKINFVLCNIFLLASYLTPLVSADKNLWAVVSIPKGTKLKIEFQKSVNSEINIEGDPIPIKVLEDVKVNTLTSADATSVSGDDVNKCGVKNIIIIKKDTQGEAILSKVKKKGILGSSGKLKIDFGTVPAVDNTPIPIFIGLKSSQKHRADALILPAAGLYLGLPGLVAVSVIQQGTPAIIPKGTQVYATINKDIKIIVPASDLSSEDLKNSSIILVDEIPIPSPLEDPSIWKLYIVKTKHREKHLLLTPYKGYLKSEKEDTYFFDPTNKTISKISKSGETELIGTVIRISDMR